LHISDISDNIPLVEFNYFADDTKIYSIIRDISNSPSIPSSEISLTPLLSQKNLNLVSEWSLKWLLKFNLDHFKLLQLGNSNPIHVYDPNIHARSFISMQGN